MISYNGGLNDRYWKFCLRIVISWRRKFSNLICWLQIWVWVIIIRWSLLNRFFSCIKFKNDSSWEQKPLFWTLRRSLIGRVLDAWVLPRYKWSLKKPELLYKNVSKKLYQVFNFYDFAVLNWIIYIILHKMIIINNLISFVICNFGLSKNNNLITEHKWPLLWLFAKFLN